MFTLNFQGSSGAFNSFTWCHICFSAIVTGFRLAPHNLDMCSKVQPKLLIIWEVWKDTRAQGSSPSNKKEKEDGSQDRTMIKFVIERPIPVQEETTGDDTTGRSQDIAQSQ